MSKSDAFENDLLKLIFQGAAIDGLADNAASGPATNLYLSLHTSDPGETGDQSTNEATYPGYARVAAPRTSSGWGVSGNTASLVADAVFPVATGGSNTLTHFAVGVGASGATKRLYSGALDNSLPIAAGVTPRILAGTAVTED